MDKKPRSPQEVARLHGQKKKYSLSLIEANMDIMDDLAKAAKTSTSSLVDEAIRAYLESQGETPIPPQKDAKK